MFAAVFEDIAQNTSLNREPGLRRFRCKPEIHWRERLATQKSAWRKGNIVSFIQVATSFVNSDTLQLNSHLLIDRWRTRKPRLSLRGDTDHGTT